MHKIVKELNKNPVNSVVPVQWSGHCVSVSNFSYSSLKSAMVKQYTLWESGNDVAKTASALILKTWVVCC